MKTSRIVLTAFAMVTLTLTGIASANETDKAGYLVDADGGLVKNSYNECWRTGSWTPADAIVECDPELVKKDEPKVADSVAPVVIPAPVAGFETITLQAETLFDFDKSMIRADGRKILDDQVVSKMKQYPRVEVILVTGYADRIGSDDYNQALSQRRADAVKAYLVDQGVNDQRIETAAKGESDPIVACDSVKGKVSGSNRNLVNCLQPNRRVTVEVKVRQPAQQ
ncbi:MAG: OmpA family protein [Sulfuriferula sp.]|nr:OmpA family protein [Sulfuriferula sp.]